MTITAHTLVKNEGRFIWYSVMSVIEHVDQILLWDTGSTDETRDILKAIKEKYPEKIDLRFLGQVTTKTFTDVRQQMLDKTDTDWFLIVDGDEIWWEDSIKRLVEMISANGNKLESIVVPTINPIGDIFHYQEEEGGKYKLAGRAGHLNLRAVKRKIPGLHSFGPHGLWGWVDENNVMIQNRKHSKIKFINAPYLHMTYLPRSSKITGDKDVPKRTQKRKYELGISFPKDYYYPEALFLEKPDIVSSPWIKRDKKYIVHALLETPFKKIKRRINMFDKIGY